MLGRPNRIADEDIDVPLPRLPFQTLDDPKSRFDEEISGYKIFMEILKLRKIQSQIKRYCVNEQASVMLREESEWRSLQAQLENWRQSFMNMQFDTYSESSAALLHVKLIYENTVLVLYRSIIDDVETCSHEIIATVMNSSCAIIEIMHLLHASDQLKPTYYLLHHVFSSGVTVLYCLWGTGTNRWPETLLLLQEGIRKCSVLLAIMADNWKDVEPFRDSFETLVSTCMKAMATSSNPRPKLDSPALDTIPVLTAGLEADEALVDMLQDLFGHEGARTILLSDEMHPYNL